MKKKERTIFREILIPLLSVLALEMLFMLGAIVVGGVIRQLNENATDMLAQQTENRGSYLLNEMIGNWSNLEMLSEELDATVQERLDAGTLRLEDLNENSAGCIGLLKDISPELIDTMYNKKISGIFVIFNTRGSAEAGASEALQGIYLRDLDPTAASSERNADLLWERAPVEVVRAGYIATDSGWKPGFSMQDSVEQAFFSKPYQTACMDDRGLKEKEYGYWTTQPYRLEGDNRTAVSYSVPLILDDGTVYGVLGVELLTDYVESLLPDSELVDNRQGSYMLAVSSGEAGALTPVVVSSNVMSAQTAGELGFVLREDGSSAQDADGAYYGAAKRLVVYSNNAPFDADKWYLVGISSQEDLFAFSRQIQQVLFFAAVLTFIVGFVGILFASYRLSKPIMRLSEEVAKAQQQGNNIPVLSATGIREIDRFADSISRLGREVVESSTRFLSIMDMASVELAGYELQEETDNVYVTHNYFPLLGVTGVDIDRMTMGEFLELQRRIHESLEHFDAEDGSTVYSVPQPDGSIRYMRSEQQNKDGRQVGLIEDVTVSTLEKQQIEQERDSDALTKLYARRGFKREAGKLFLKPEVLKRAGLLMIDLDNLKSTNDRFGHKFGDLYIQTAGKCFVENTPENTLCARMGGDEFILFFYGYDSVEAIRERVAALYKAIREVEFVLPNGENMGLSASGGIAWYPGDCEELSGLMKFADFAMYQVKQSKKGAYKEFDMKLYRQQQLQNQSRLELHKLLEARDVNYCFQPIFTGREGALFAYEALMRSDLPTLQMPETVLTLAREEGRMHDVEYITLFRATECYRQLLEDGAVPQKALLFINSIADECMTDEEQQVYHELYHALQERIVIEITEAEHLDMEKVQRKRSIENFSGMFALDNYGSGHGTEMNLRELNPRFVKVDSTIVREVDKDTNKQQVIRNLVAYAHGREMQVIAVGVENAAELETVLALGADFVQGDYLAKPEHTPAPISEEALAVIRALQAAG
ncbi:MAG: EAL domain-containing protein [Roseburia sp.]|nr:EAL domain-containing protein [Roseburia sp.]